MKYKILLSLLLFFGLKSSIGLAQCVNGTETNPSAPMPTNAGFKTNTFDWRQNPIPINGKFLALPALNNPFFGTDSRLKAIQGGSESDSKPSDGWELIKQDFGYAYKDGTWKGQTLFEATSANKSGRAYMMLYNKYSGTLRILAVMNRLSNQDQVVVILSLVPKENDKSNRRDLTFNALFNRYNNQQTALDQNTKIGSVFSPAQLTSGDSDFFYADFQLSYDPCVCFFKSALQVSFWLKISSNLELSGKPLKQNIDIALQNSTLFSEYLTSLGTRLSGPGFNQQYSDIANLKKELNLKSGEAGIALSKMTNLLSQSAKLTTTSSNVFDSLNINDVNKIGKLANMLDFLSIFNNGKDKTSGPSVIPADVSAKGSLVAVPINGSEFLLATQGSKDAASLPEYPVSLPPSEGIKPMYPMYNEMAGRFAVVKTPEILYSCSNCEKPSNIHRYNYKLSDTLPNISYAFNPIVDVKKTKIFVAIEYKATDATVRFVDTITQFLPIENARHLISQFTTCGLDKYDILSYNFRIVFQIFYQFKPDASGNVKLGYDLIKVKPKLTLNQIDLSKDPRFVFLSNTPKNLKIGNTVFKESKNIYSLGNINVEGDLTNNTNTTITIAAQGSVSISSTVKIIGKFEFKNNQILPPEFPKDTPSLPMGYNDIQTFCNSTDYKAMILSTEKNADTTVTSEIKPLSFSIYPNPFSNQFSIEYNIEINTTVVIELFNALGQSVKIINLGIKNKGCYQDFIETSDLASGIYLLTLRTQNGTETKKIVKQ
jgi:Secretion system C-terminal sorting domain